MNILQKLKDQKYEYINEEYNKLKDTFLEMAVLKSEFDIEKLTVKKHGAFVAHNYHFLIRQYSLALQELRRYTIEKEECLRNIAEYQEMLKQGKTRIGKKYIDLEIRSLENRIDSIELSMANKAYSCEHYEKCRQALIQMNGCKEPTNDQYQSEEPKYLKWFLERELMYDHVTRATGIRTGVLTNIDHLEENPVLRDDFKVKVNKLENKEQFEKLQKTIKALQNIDNFEGTGLLENESTELLS